MNNIQEEDIQIIGAGEAGTDQESEEDRFALKLLRSSGSKHVEASLAIQLDKLEPIGYQKAAKIFNENSGSIKDSSFIWLVVEAEAAGMTDQLNKDFPQAIERSERALSFMKKNQSYYR
jgi:hypothetical protein